MSIFTPVFKHDLDIRTAYFFLNPVSHLFLRGELSSNTQVNLNLVKGRFIFSMIVFLTMEDNLNEVKRLNLVDFPIRHRKY